MCKSKKVLIEEAIQGLRTGLYKSKRHASRCLGISHTTITANIIQPTGKSGGHNKALPDEAEEALKRYCDRCITLGTNPEPKHIRQAANQLLRELNIPRHVSRGWVSRFIQRNPKYKYRKSRSLSGSTTLGPPISLTT